jgi:hypothetical protein
VNPDEFIKAILNTNNPALQRGNVRVPVEMGMCATSSKTLPSSGLHSVEDSRSCGTSSVNASTRYYRREEAVGTLFGFLPSLGIVLSCLGLLGLTMPATDRRKKEMGIR